MKKTDNNKLTFFIFYFIWALGLTCQTMERNDKNNGNKKPQGNWSKNQKNVNDPANDFNNLNVESQFALIAAQGSNPPVNSFAMESKKKNNTMATAHNHDSMAINTRSQKRKANETMASNSELMMGSSTKRSNNRPMMGSQLPVNTIGEQSNTNPMANQSINSTTISNPINGQPLDISTTFIRKREQKTLEKSNVTTRSKAKITESTGMQGISAMDTPMADSTPQTTNINSNGIMTRSLANLIQSSSTTEPKTTIKKTNIKKNKEAIIAEERSKPIIEERLEQSSENFTIGVDIRLNNLIKENEEKIMAQNSSCFSIVNENIINRMKLCANAYPVYQQTKIINLKKKQEQDDLNQTVDTKTQDSTPTNGERKINWLEMGSLLSTVLREELIVLRAQCNNRRQTKKNIVLFKYLRDLSLNLQKDLKTVYCKRIFPFLFWKDTMFWCLSLNPLDESYYKTLMDTRVNHGNNIFKAINNIHESDIELKKNNLILQDMDVQTKYVESVLNMPSDSWFNKTKSPPIDVKRSLIMAKKTKDAFSNVSKQTLKNLFTVQGKAVGLNDQVLVMGSKDQIKKLNEGAGDPLNSLKNNGIIPYPSDFSYDDSQMLYSLSNMSIQPNSIDKINNFQKSTPMDEVALETIGHLLFGGQVDSQYSSIILLNNKYQDIVVNYPEHHLIDLETRVPNKEQEQKIQEVFFKNFETTIVFALEEYRTKYLNSLTFLTAQPLSKSSKIIFENDQDNQMLAQVMKVFASPCFLDFTFGVCEKYFFKIKGYEGDILNNFKMKPEASFTYGLNKNPFVCLDKEPHRCNLIKLSYGAREMRTDILFPALMYMNDIEDRPLLNMESILLQWPIENIDGFVTFFTSFREKYGDLLIKYGNYNRNKCRPFENYGARSIFNWQFILIDFFIPLKKKYPNVFGTYKRVNQQQAFIEKEQAWAEFHLYMLEFLIKHAVKNFSDVDYTQDGYGLGFKEQFMFRNITEKLLPGVIKGLTYVSSWTNKDDEVENSIFNWPRKDNRPKNFNGDHRQLIEHINNILNKNLKNNYLFHWVSEDWEEPEKEAPSISEVKAPSAILIKKAIVISSKKILMETSAIPMGFSNGAEKGFGHVKIVTQNWITEKDWEMESNDFSLSNSWLAKRIPLNVEAIEDYMERYLIIDSKTQSLIQWIRVIKQAIHQRKNFKTNNGLDPLKYRKNPGPLFVNLSYWLSIIDYSHGIHRGLLKTLTNTK